MKIKTNNFQILEGENTFEFTEGINIVVGQNASGKSSMFYAVENCLTNPSGVDDCINYNHKSTDVTIENNGNSITWTRTSTSSQYTNNATNEVYAKASKLDSRDIADLGFYFDKKGKVVNIHSEWDVLFPFGTSDTDMFRLFEDIFNISCSFQVIEEMKKDESTVKSTINDLTAKKQSLQDRRDKLSTILSSVRSEDITAHINQLQSNLQQLSNVREDCKLFSKHTLIKDIVLPNPFDITSLETIVNKYQTVKSDCDLYDKSVRLASISVPSISLDLTSIEEPIELRKDYDEYTRNFNIIEGCKNDTIVLELKRREIESKIAEIKVCPTCGRPLEEV